MKSNQKKIDKICYSRVLKNKYTKFIRVEIGSKTLSVIHRVSVNGVPKWMLNIMRLDKLWEVHTFCQYEKHYDLRYGLGRDCEIFVQYMK